MFDYEREMRPIVTDWLEQQGFTCMFERCMGMSGARADVVAVEFDRDKAQKRIENRDATSWGAAWRCSEQLVNPPTWYPVHRQVWAIELKLARWQEAVSQARTYAYSATHSYIALPASKLEGQEQEPLLDRIVAECEKHGIGLLSVRPDGVSGLKRADYMPKRTYAAFVVSTVEKAWKVYKREQREGE